MTTTTTSPAAYLYGLPEPIQAQLVDIARAAIGASPEEKGYATGTFATVSHWIAKAAPDYALPAGHMLVAVAEINRLAQVYASATEGEC